jgi:hypothetical protein
MNAARIICSVYGCNIKSYGLPNYIGKDVISSVNVAGLKLP